ncbi:hypothetical protein A2U01_0079297, partial [Trifolium medium]|nr:hypothetical protein [Trifolium medium]
SRGGRWASSVSLGEDHASSFIALARNLREVDNAFSLGEGLLAGRAGGDLSPIYSANHHFLHVSIHF